MYKIFDINFDQFFTFKLDLPAIISLVIEHTKGKGIKVIKRGGSYFELRIGNISLRDACNYLGPGSLSKFAKIYSIPEGKKLFPYEMFSDVTELFKQKKWPAYVKFKNSLAMKVSHINELTGLITQFDNFGTMMNHFGCDLNLHDAQYTSKDLPIFSDSQKDQIDNFFTISPTSFLDHEKSFNLSIKLGVYKDYSDYLKEYNVSDTKLLIQVFSKFCEQFKSEFNVDVLNKLSLPAVSEGILWQMYDERYPKIVSFGEKYGHLNSIIRENILGGPSIIFHERYRILYPDRVDDKTYTSIATCGNQVKGKFPH